LISISLALTAAFLFALGAQFSRLGLQHASSAQGALIQITVSAILFWLFSPFFIERYFWLAPVALLFAAMGVFRPFLSSRLAMAGNKRLGPTITSTMAGISPLFGVALGVLALGETLTTNIFIGATGIFCGVTLLSWRDRNIPRGWPLWALLLPLAAAFIRAVTNLFAKLGMESLASPYFVSLVGTTVATAVAFSVTRRSLDMALLKNGGARWFIMTGTCYALAMLALNTALSQGRLVAIAPILACAPLFSLFLGFTVFG